MCRIVIGKDIADNGFFGDCSVYSRVIIIYFIVVFLASTVTLTVAVSGTVRHDLAQFV